ncbi:MAG TPA: Rieske 2Fe-2S domain-containing protein [Baekduia sp.]
MSRFVVGPAREIPPGSVRVVHPESEQAGIGVFNVGGEFYALRNHCPHMGAPLCSGSIKGAGMAKARPSGAFEVEWAREGEIISCPWHHWEFEIKSGRTIFPSKSRVRRYDVALEEPEPGSALEERLKRGVETVPVVVEDDATVVLLLGGAA